VARVSTWYEYRDAWGTRPWLLAIALLAVALILAGIAGTVLQSPLAYVFIPGLAVLFLHHLLVERTSRAR
jgi:hypothetical protein